MAYPYPSTENQAVPVVPPMSSVPSSVPQYATVLPAGSPEVPPLSQTTSPSSQLAPPTSEDLAEQSRSRLLKWGALGVVLGASANVLVTALAFKSYQKSTSCWKPALWAGAGSAVIGGTLLWILSRGVTTQLDDRMAAATIGAKLAV